ncbi:putative protein [Mycolicibacterium vanbaalenii]|uniref:Secreted protein n=1 Tax=Mycolicibacterium vanbaalenii TaxID=110539 RepID=A0A5S9R6W2_MYCVN|nr:hypothetical protein [Mycolicibacterium vanbaalenii]CAA0130859.1 putative protein [Mycolicibacterium vanbaalenii]
MLFCKPLPLVAAAAVGLFAASAVIADVDAGAQPGLHHVRYTVGASEDIANAEIYYRDTQPPNWAEYSHNTYLYTPNAEANLGPGQPWVLEAMLADPEDWAMVVVGLPGPTTAPLTEPGFVCELRVDDVVVATDSGTKGALCSLRTW